LDQAFNALEHIKDYSTKDAFVKELKIAAAADCKCTAAEGTQNVFAKYPGIIEGCLCGGKKQHNLDRCSSGSGSCHTVTSRDAYSFHVWREKGLCTKAKKVLRYNTGLSTDADCGSGNKKNGYYCIEGNDMAIMSITSDATGTVAFTGGKWKETLAATTSNEYYPYGAIESGFDHAPCLETNHFPKKANGKHYYPLQRKPHETGCGEFGDISSFSTQIDKYSALSFYKDQDKWTALKFENWYKSDSFESSEYLATEVLVYAVHRIWINPDESLCQDMFGYSKEDLKETAKALSDDYIYCCAFGIFFTAVGFLFGVYHVCFKSEKSRSALLTLLYVLALCACVVFFIQAGIHLYQLQKRIWKFHEKYMQTILAKHCFKTGEKTYLEKPLKALLEYVTDAYWPYEGYVYFLFAWSSAFILVALISFLVYRH
jgi:hypothetical protein